MLQTKEIKINNRVFKLSFCEKLNSFMTASSCKRMQNKCKKISKLPEHLKFLLYEDLLIFDLPCLSCEHPIT